MFAPITKFNEGESNTPCPSILEITYSSVEKLSKALNKFRFGVPYIANNRAVVCPFFLITMTTLKRH
jgi:hypothetical protein